MNSEFDNEDYEHSAGTTALAAKLAIVSIVLGLVVLAIRSTKKKQK